MAPLNFNLDGYLYGSSLRTIRKSFKTSVTALDDEILHAKEEAFAHQQELERGLVSDDELAEDGTVLFNRSAILSMEVDQIEAARMILCKAFALSAFHQWERAVREWTHATPGQNFEKLVAAATAKGAAMHPRLKVVRNLANSLKHGTNVYGGSLLKDWPDLFEAGFQPSSTNHDWYRAIRLYEKHVNEVFDILKASGPPLTNAHT